MAKSNNQKAKLLFLEKMLRETGENRAVSMQEILEMLLSKGIRAERKSIYDDLDALRAFGMDIQFKRGRPGGYYVAGQTAPEMPAQEEPGEGKSHGTDSRDLGLLEAGAKEDVSQVQGSQEAGAKEGVFQVQGSREASAKEGVSQAKGSREASAKEDRSREKGSQEDDSKKEKISGKTSRMSGEDPETQALPVPKFEREASGDRKKQMRLLCTKDKEWEVRAFFGKYADYKEKDAASFTVTAPNMSSPQFFGWLTAMGREVHIVKPKKTAAAYRDYLKALAKEYKGI